MYADTLCASLAGQMPLIDSSVADNQPLQTHSLAMCPWATH
jgi:hypothetical protein